MRSVEQSLLRTGLSSIDVLLIHDVDVWTHGDNYERRFGEAMGGAYKALDELRRTGFTKAIGVGVNEAEVATRFATEGDFDTVLLAGRYSLLEQPALKTFLPLAMKQEHRRHPRRRVQLGHPGDGAVPGAKYDYAPASPEIMERVRRIEAVCARHGTPLRRAALAFALAHPAVISVIIGAVKPDEPRSNAAELGAADPRSALGRPEKRRPPGAGRRRSGLRASAARSSGQAQTGLIGSGRSLRSPPASSSQPFSPGGISNGSRPCRSRAGARHRR